MDVAFWMKLDRYFYCYSSNAKIAFYFPRYIDCQGTTILRYHIQKSCCNYFIFLLIFSNSIILSCARLLLRMRALPPPSPLVAQSDLQFVLPPSKKSWIRPMIIGYIHVSALGIWKHSWIFAVTYRYVEGKSVFEEDKTGGRGLNTGRGPDPRCVTLGLIHLQDDAHRYNNYSYVRRLPPRAEPHSANHLHQFTARLASHLSGSSALGE